MPYSWDMNFLIIGILASLLFLTRVHDRVLRHLSNTVLTVLLLFVPVARAADKPIAGSWDQVAKLQTGQPIRVIDKSGTQHSGRFSTLTDAAISLTTTKSDVRIDRADVEKIEVQAEHRVRNGLIGAGIGLAVGITIDQTVGKYFRNESGESNGVRA